MTALVICAGRAAGLGKTTLAHVAARHCGYRPVEINASDDRTAATLGARVADAVQMIAVLGERRPNCVVVDEVDGATGAALGSRANPVSHSARLPKGAGQCCHGFCAAQHWRAATSAGSPGPSLRTRAMT